MSIADDIKNLISNLSVFERIIMILLFFVAIDAILLYIQNPHSYINLFSQRKNEIETWKWILKDKRVIWCVYSIIAFLIYLKLISVAKRVVSIINHIPGFDLGKSAINLSKLWFITKGARRVTNTSTFRSGMK
jgi:hypothetical protein